MEKSGRFELDVDEVADIAWLCMEARNRVRVGGFDVEEFIRGAYESYCEIALKFVADPEYSEGRGMREIAKAELSVPEVLAALIDVTDTNDEGDEVKYKELVTRLRGMDLELKRFCRMCLREALRHIDNKTRNSFNLATAGHIAQLMVILAGD